MSVIQSTYPALNSEWITRLLINGNIKQLFRQERVFQTQDKASCIFVVDGLLLNENEEGMQLLKQGDVYGLRETLFSVDLSHDKNAQKLIDLPSNMLTSLSQSTTFLEVDGAFILDDMEKNPELREGWLYVLNNSFEKQLNDGLHNYQLGTLDLLRHILKQLKEFADEQFAVPIQHIQELTGISRSSIYRCLKTLEEEEQFVFCAKGHICFCNE